MRSGGCGTHETMKIIKLVGLPSTCSVVWSHLYENSDHHINDEDIVWINLNNGIMIDAGQYGKDPSFFKVEVVPENDEWESLETSICKTTSEVASEITRLANKFSDKWYANILKSIGQHVNT